MDLRIQNTEETPTNVCLFDTLDPNTGGTVFDPADLEADTDTVFVSESDASTWVYNGSAYITKTFEIPDNTPFWLYGTSLDAGGNKTAMIQRNGPIFVNSSTSNGSRYAGYFYSRATSGQGNGMLIRKDSRTTSGNYLLIEGRNFSTGVNEEKFKVGHNGDLTINDAYTLPTTDGAVGEVLQTDGTGNVAWASSGGGSGVLGISDASGTYTYYSTLSAAMTAATSGDTIEMFADIEETGSITITLKDGVKINGNGHTYTLSVNDATNAFTYSAVGTIELFNLKVLRTGRTAGTSTGYCLFFDNSGAIIRCNGVTFENDFGSACRGRGKIYGAKAFAYITAIADSSGSCSVYDCYGESTGTGVGIACNGYISNSTGISISSTGIQATNGTVVNCVGISTSGYGIFGNASNSVGISSSSSGLHSGNYKACTGISVSSYGSYRSTLTNCTILSTSGVASFENSIYNCYVQTNANVAAWIRDNTEIKNCNIVNNYNATTGHGTSSAVVRTGIKIHNTTIKVANASAFCISSYPNCTVSYLNNSFQGSTTPVSSNVIQITTNTSDSQGNILV